MTLYSAFAIAAVTALAAIAPAYAAAPTPAVPTAQAMPNGVATFTATRIAIGVGYAWGRGVLTYRGQSHPFTVRGLSALGIGASTMTGTADVYNLTTMADFEGVYGAVSAGASVGPAGAGAGVLRNAKGVELRLTAQEEGLELSLAISGVTIAFDPR
jgi:hypothetical protein